MNKIIKNASKTHMQFPEKSRMYEQHLDPERASMDHNAMCYVRSIHDPQGAQGCRIPDLTGLLTSTYQDVNTVTLSLVTGSTSGYAAAVWADAHPTGHIITLTELITLESGWGTTISNSANLSFMTTNFEAMRCVSMGMEIYMGGKLLDRGTFGLLYSGVSEPNTVLSSFLDNNRSVQFTPSDAEVHKVSWQPVFGSFNDDGSYEGFSSNWFSPASATGTFSEADPQIGVIIWTEASGLSDTIEVRITTNYECLPIGTVAKNFEGRMVVGGEESIAKAKLALGKAVNSSSPAVKRAYNKGVVLHADAVDVAKGAEYLWDKIGKPGMKSLKTLWKNNKQYFQNAMSLGEEVAGTAALLERHKLFALLQDRGLIMHWNDPMIDALMPYWQDMTKWSRLSELVRALLRARHVSPHTRPHRARLKLPCRSVIEETHAKLMELADDVIVVSRS